MRFVAVPSPNSFNTRYTPYCRSNTLASRLRAKIAAPLTDVRLSDFNEASIQLKTFQRKCTQTTILPSRDPSRTQKARWSKTKEKYMIGASRTT